MTASRLHTMGMPCITRSSAEPQAIESCSNLFIAVLPSHLANDLDRFDLCHTTVMAGLVFGHSQFRMPAACPMQYQNDLLSGLIDIDDNFLDQNMDNTLLKAHVRCWGIPDHW